MSNRSAWLKIACPDCRASPGSRCGEWLGGLGSRERWVSIGRLHVARGWGERYCPKCDAWPGHPRVTPTGRSAIRIHGARLRPARGELLLRADVWAELERGSATIATVPFWGRAGAGGQADRITLLRPGGDALVEMERWSSRDELCHALESPIWERFGTFVGQPLIRGEVVRLSDERTVEIIATRGDKPFQERVR